METDDAVAMIEDLEEDEQRACFASSTPTTARRSRRRSPIPRIGRSADAARPDRGAEHWTVGQVIDYLRAGEDLTTDFWEVFVVDGRHHPVGTCMLSWILRTTHIAVADVMKREQTLIPVDMDQEEVALRFQKYALISAAVIDQSGGWWG
jgi:magnesium transporter